MADFREIIRAQIKTDLASLYSKEKKRLKLFKKTPEISLSGFLDQIQVYSIKDRILSSEVTRVSIPVSYFNNFKMSLHTLGFLTSKIYLSDLDKANEKKSSFKIKKLLKINKNLIEVGDIVVALKSEENNLITSKYNKKNKLLHKKVISVKINKDQIYAIREISKIEFCVEDENGNALWWSKKLFKLIEN